VTDLRQPVQGRAGPAASYPGALPDIGKER